jgi:hypothetical protein
MPASEPIRISVSYERAEYVDFVRAHQRRVRAFDREFAARGVKPRPGRALALAIALAAAAAAAWVAWASPPAAAALAVAAVVALLYAFAQSPQFVPWVTTVIANIAFVLKKRRIGDCHFAIDATGIRRTARDGELWVPWAKVVAERLRPVTPARGRS